ncbi:AIPR family protein [Celeribacter sp.]|uniref:AIPR family protein n=1 Tax=Celeribacter sp. TaxID=1890673 RepID=UPI003A912B79
MSTNDQVVLSQVIQQRNASKFPHLSFSQYFELFCAEEILKDYELSYDELLSGIVDGEHDGGIDSVYTFVNGSLVREDFEAAQLKNNVEIELAIFQSKSSKGFSEDGLNAISSTLRKLLDLTENDQDFPELNTAIKDKFADFRDAYLKLASCFPGLTINVYYCAAKADDNVHENLYRKAEEVKLLIENLFSKVNASVHLVGPSRLLSIARRIPKTSFSMKIDQHLSDGDGYVVLSHLEDFNAFLRDENGVRQERIFESNVRDNAGNVPVNSEIRETLRNEVTVDFWMLNNGVTIVADRAFISGQCLELESPQIVNGLQTSTQILDHFDELSFRKENRKIMVKVVPLTDEESRDKIIKSTNSQTSVSPITLRATDKIHRDIEEALKSHDIFYDRRKNHYKNRGVEPQKIIGIPQLAQAMMAIVLQRPDDARARPSTLLNDKKSYDTVFSNKMPIESYVSAAKLLKSVEEVLGNRPDISAKDRNNIKFYVVYHVAALATKKDKITANQLAFLLRDFPSTDAIEQSINSVLKIYRIEGDTDQVAKGPRLLSAISSALRQSGKVLTQPAPAASSHRSAPSSL